MKQFTKSIQLKLLWVINKYLNVLLMYQALLTDNIQPLVWMLRARDLKEKLVPGSVLGWVLAGGLTGTR